MSLNEINSSDYQPSGSGKPYYIPMPPPNITGKLHMGHALGITIQDTLARHYRNQGYDTLYLPGQDHAGYATQDKIELELLEKRYQKELDDNILFSLTCQKTAKELAQDHWQDIIDDNDSRILPTFSEEEKLAFASDWEKYHRSFIKEQTMGMMASADWSKERYTLDQGMIDATIHAFNELYYKGLIYEKDGKWYLKQKELTQPIYDAIASGELTIYPENAKTKLLQTPDGDELSNLRDWEISREGWWGIKMPIWYNEQGEQIIALSSEMVQILTGKNNQITQTNLIFDTWFTSTLWTFAALGYPYTTELMERYYPAALLETGEDILYFWGTRMMMMGYALTGKLPYKTIYLHGLIRDNKGRKMSKSLGNGILPEEMLDKYGLDATRFALLSNTYAGQDLKLTEDKFIAGSRFTNKIWNAAKFILANTINEQPLQDGKNINYFANDLNDSLIDLETEFNQLIAEYKFAQASTLARDYFFNTFSGFYIERYKQHFSDDEIASYALRNGFKKYLNLINPIMPSITKYLKQQLGD
jgi:valyl-tRNA synthetase